MRPLSLYIHIPFCTRRCSYCSFYHVPAARERERAFVDALVSEIEAVLPHAGDVELRTVFAGGGTPTVIEPEQWQRVVRALAPWVPAGGVPEFTVEMNPEDVGDEMPRFLRDLGANRASLGIQSMHEVGQKVLKRCAPDVNERAIARVRDAFDNVSFDVLLGVPRTTPEDLARTLGRLLEFAPDHLSVYGLEPGGDMGHEVERFFRAVDPDRVADEYLTVCDTLARAGYGHYEVSNFARPGRESAHNRVYWDGGDYLGVGPAAHSCVGGRRFWNAPDVAAYSTRRGEEHIAARVHDEAADAAMEDAMLGLRTDRGIALADCGADPARVRELAEDGLITIEQGRVRATDRGYLVLNDLMLRLSLPAGRAAGTQPC